MFGNFIVRIVLPTLLTIALFVVAIFVFLLPAFERALLERRREMIRELTHSAWNILANFQEEVDEGLLTLEQAQAEAIRQIRHLHYGPQMKDYFWVNDMQPQMIVHPYRRDLEGLDLTHFADPDGKRLFVDMVELVRRSGSGYVDYHWQWQDEAALVERKISYVKGFEPWGWIIGTGIYIDDVQEEIQRLTHRLGLVSLGILALAGTLLTVGVVESLRTEKRRQAAVDALRRSEERYRTLVEAAGESIFMALDDDHLYANASALRMLGYDEEEFARLRFDDLLESPSPATVDGQPPSKREATLRRRDGSTVHVMLAESPIRLGGRQGIIVVATDITERKEAEQAIGRSESQLRQTVEDLRASEKRQLRQLQDLRLTVAQLKAPGTDHHGLTAYLQALRLANTPEQAIGTAGQLPGLVAAMAGCGTRPELLTRFISTAGDALVEALIRLAIAELGPPPADFAFMVMGSQARFEQTLKTDQDNAIVFADLPEAQLPAAQAYFVRLGERVCDALAQAGYAYCEGGVMARNERWCQPLCRWQADFANWIGTLEAEDLLNVKIFFDFRAVAGQVELVAALQVAVQAALAANPRFFFHLGRNLLLAGPPIGVFGNLQLEKPDGKPRGFDLKTAMLPVVDFARIYALENAVRATSTGDRLEQLASAGVLSRRNAEEVAQVFSALMQIRLGQQIRALEQGLPPDNWVAPKELTYIERRVIKESVAGIRDFQSRITNHFVGSAGAAT